MRKLKESIPLVNRELSWLDFNERVLQEANDPSVPLIERVRFLGIFSNNLDEYYRVRVATVTKLTKLPAKERKKLSTNPFEILKEINKRTIQIQNKFEKTYQNLIKQLKKEDIILVNDKTLLPEHYQFVENYFDKVLNPTLVPIMIGERNFPPLNGKSIYFAIKLKYKNDVVDYAIVEIPSLVLDRFVVLPSINKKKYVILIDDIIRYKLKSIFYIFDCEKVEAYTIKVTLDAELDIDDDVSESVIDKLAKSLKNRRKAQPVRLVYDKEIPQDLLNTITSKLKGSIIESLIPGGRYHNFKDFINFPNIGTAKLTYKRLPPLQHPMLKKNKSILNQINKGDILLNYPFQSFNHIIDLLREAAIDPEVKSIKINLYRLAKNSKIIHALISAVKNNKKVTVIIELRARFDEEANIYWANKLQDEGVKVLFGIKGLKVHSKLILISRAENKRTVKYGHIGTGNFNENTAGLYTDMSLLTKSPQITNEINKVFSLFKDAYVRPSFRHLVVSPINARRKLNALISNEIANCKNGNPSGIILKLNNLVDTAMIKKLYQASSAGVPIKLIIRGNCALVPGIKKVSENIEVISIVDRFLEHARIMIFNNNNNELYYLSSADWMGRNLDKRVEVGCPIYDKNLKKIIQDTIDLQLKDNTKARFVNSNNHNKYKKGEGNKKYRSQLLRYDYYKKLLNK